MRKRPFVKRHATHTSVYTQGQVIPGMPFMGEQMECVMCGKTQMSDPKVESQWRSLTVNGRRFYACPDEFPPDGEIAQKFTIAYDKILKKCLTLL